MKSWIFAVLMTVVAASPVWAAGGGSSNSAKDPLVGQAKEFIKAEKYAAAIPILEQALAAKADNSDAHNLLGFSLRKLGQFDKAQASYEKALSLNAEHKGALEYLGELYLETGRPNDARKMLARLDSACFFGCEEYDDLKKLIEASN